MRDPMTGILGTLSSFGITEQSQDDTEIHWNFGTLSSFGITELSTFIRYLLSDFGTLSSFGITELFFAYIPAEGYFGTLSSFGITNSRKQYVNINSKGQTNGNRSNSYIPVHLINNTQNISYLHKYYDELVKKKWFNNNLDISREMVIKARLLKEDKVAEYLADLFS